MLEVVAEAWIRVDDLAGCFGVTLGKKLFLVLDVRLSYFFSLLKFINWFRFTVAVVVKPRRDVIVIRRIVLLLFFFRRLRPNSDSSLTSTITHFGRNKRLFRQSSICALEVSQTEAL